MKPYIGITGFMNAEEARFASGVFRKEKGIIRNFAGGEILRFEPDYILMVGVLASLKTLYGHTNKWPNRYPAVKDISGIFLQNPDALKLVHYNSENTELLFAQLMALTELIGPWQFDGFQLNIFWPSDLELSAYKSAYPDKKIVLQIGKEAFKAIGDSPDNLAANLTMYSGLVDYFLLDLSRGKGLLLDTEKLRPYLRVITKTMKNTGIGVAGGLSPSTVHLIKPLLDEFPCLCIDAEGKLRDENDHLDLNVVKNYISTAFNVFKPF